MPSIETAANKKAEMATMSSSIETFETFESKTDHDSDEDSFHLPLTDDEVENNKHGDNSDDILDQLESIVKESINTEIQNGSNGKEKEDDNKKCENGEQEKDNKVENNIEDEKLEEIENEDKLLEGDDDEDMGNKDTLNKSGTQSPNLDVLDTDKEEEDSKELVKEMTTESEEVCEKKDDQKETPISEEVKQDKPEEMDTSEEKLKEEKPTEEKPTEEKPSEEKPTEEKPTEEKSTETKSIEEKSTEEKSTEEKFTEEKSTEEKSTEEKFTEEKSTEEKSTEEKFTEEKSTEEKSTEEKFTEEKSTEESLKGDKEGSDNEDLLDITVVKDTGEDDAECAQNELNLNEEAKEAERDADLDNDDEDSSGNNSDKMEDEETENKVTDHLLSDDKKTDDDGIEKMETNEISTEVQIDESNEVTEDKTAVEEDKTETEEIKETLDETITVENDDVELLTCNESVSTLCNESIEVTTEDCASKKGIKRTIPDEHLVEPSPPKKLKTIENEKEKIEDADDNDNNKKEEIANNKKEEKSTKDVEKNLLALEEFMKNSKCQKKLNLIDLEQFCTQKICESIVHQSQLGDYHHQLKVYEQTIELMRKEIVQLAKQARDLEIVNKKLLSDLYNQNGQKPLQPLKITRSVGLQVKFATTAETPGTKRRPSNGSTATTTPTVSPQITTNQLTKVVQPVNKIPRNTQNTIPPRQPTVTVKQTKTPILSQVLTGRKIIPTAANTATVHAMAQTTPKKTPEPKSGIIDLTDEDDKNKSKTIIRTVNGPNNARTQFNQGIRVNSPQKITPMTSVVTSSAPVMYVVSQSSNMLGGTNQKAVLVNLQGSNAVLTSTALNGQVSVISKANGTVSQLKTTTVTSQQQKQITGKQVKLKHPAPLPPPPQIRLPLLDRQPKALPPKPILTIRKTDTGIILQWKMPYELELYEAIASYQLYAYQETNTPPSTDMWRRVGDVKALALPMACTLTQFADRNKYYFAVRPVDIHKRIGPFSDPKEISL